MEQNIYQVDAFADQLFEGNPAAVCPLKEWLPAPVMQKIAMENNLAETAFFVREKEEYHIRWFTPTIEVDLCGHATLATAHILFEALGFDQEKIIFKSRSGPLEVVKHGDLYTMDFPADQLKAVEAPKLLIEGIGQVPLEVYRGRDDYLLIFKNQSAIEKLQPNFEKIARIPARGIITSAPGDSVDFVSRCFFPASGINEDPVTGSAHTTLCPYWAKKYNKSTLKARQISARGGNLHCELSETRVKISGKAITYMKGSIFI